MKNEGRNVRVVEIRKMSIEDFLDFCKVYLVFTLHPYNEKYTLEEMWQEFLLLTNGGAVYGYYKNGECVGIVTFNKKECYNHPVHYDADKKVAYLSDVAVLPEYRNKGIGTELMKHVLECARQDGYDIMYMRTLQPGQSMSYGIAIKLGFELLDETEVIDRERNDENRDTKDIRIFLEKILK